jgi:hypothetical protein
MGPLRRASAIVVLLACTAVTGACRHAVMVADAGPKPPPAEGTISGLLQTPGNGAAVVGRKVTVINNADGRRYEVSTNNTGGFTVKVPAGTYRIEVEQQPGEVVTGAPTAQHVGASDIDARIVITVGPA